MGGEGKMNQILKEKSEKPLTQIERVKAGEEGKNEKMEKPLTHGS